MAKLDRALKIFFISALLALSADMINIFAFTPQEAVQGIVQKIFYIHVPSAMNMYLGFLIGFVFSVLYLWKRKPLFDQIAYSGIEVGFVFACAVLISGPLWAKGAWGKFWHFDPRLTSTLVIWFIYLSYLLLRRYFGDTAKAKIFAAVLAVIGFIDVPIVHYSVKIWRGIHPSVLAGRAQGSMPQTMWNSLILSVLAFVLVFGFMFLLRLKKGLEYSREEE